MKEPKGSCLRICQNCLFMTPAPGLQIPIPVCLNKFDQEGSPRIVQTFWTCNNFKLNDHLRKQIKQLDENTCLIALNKGCFALIDKEDYPKLKNFRWKVQGSRNQYAYTARKKKTIYMHRFLANPSVDKVVDHINHNTLDNRKSNLRICTPAQNNYNASGKKYTTSQYKGVSWITKSKKWIVTIKQKNKKYFLGYFKDEIEAARTYDKKAKELFGEFAYLNFPSDYTKFS
ncbi:MAG: hypothetical protein GF364_11060 [Candidatus Lokiarchaeota archaeon]|nr:hypothetical protein [Candidatus Lokiarchaeota archaeon]